MGTLAALVLLVAQEETVRAAVTRALVPLQKSAAEYPNQRTCFSCHNQTLPLLAFTLARERGIAVDEKVVKDVVRFTAASLEGGKEAYASGKGQGGKSATASYGLWTLELGGYKPDATTARVAEFLLGDDKGRPFWKPPSNRPPLEFTPFTTTALSIRALQTFGTEGQKDRIAGRIEAAKTWLLETKPAETEERVFRLYGLHYVGAEVKDAVRELLETQQKDGGWGQKEGMESDAYATGSALLALHQAGGTAVADAAWQRGLRFLLSTQKEDGTWHVKTRSKPIQSYFESGFPHGKDQFISISATGWAAAALALSLPK